MGANLICDSAPSAHPTIYNLSFFSEPETQFLEEGQPLKLGVVVSGVPKPSVTWYLDETAMGEGNSLYFDHALKVLGPEEELF